MINDNNKHIDVALLKKKDSSVEYVIVNLQSKRAIRISKIQAECLRNSLILCLGLPNEAELSGEK